MGMTKSAQIRELYDHTELSVGEIADTVGVRYQFAYNVIRKLCDERGEEVRKAVTLESSEDIRQYLDQGYTVDEITKAFDLNPAFVKAIADAYEKAKNGDELPGPEAKLLEEQQKKNEDEQAAARDSNIEDKGFKKLSKAERKQLRKQQEEQRLKDLREIRGRLDGENWDD